MHPAEASLVPLPFPLSSSPRRSSDPRNATQPRNFNHASASRNIAKLHVVLAKLLKIPLGFYAPLHVVPTPRRRPRSAPPPSTYKQTHRDISFACFIFIHHIQIETRSRVIELGRDQRRGGRSLGGAGHGEPDGQGQGVRGGQDRAHAQAGGVAGQGDLQGHDPRGHHRAQPRQRHQPLLPPHPHMRHRLQPQVRRQGGGERHDPGPGVDRGQRRGHQAGGAGQGALRLPHLAHQGPGQGLGHRLRAPRQAHHRPPHHRQLHHPARDRRRVQAAHPQRLLRRLRQDRGGHRLAMISSI